MTKELINECDMLYDSIKCMMTTNDVDVLNAMYWLSKKRLDRILTENRNRIRENK